jgi:hypothetical protein
MTDLIASQPRARQIAHHAVLILSARAAQVNEHLRNRVLGEPRHAARRTD